MTRLRRLVLAPAACASLVVLASCGSDDAAERPQPDTTELAATAAPADSTEQAPAATSAADAAVPEVLRFSAPAVGGGEIDAAALAGTPTVFWFWAPT